MGFSKGFESRNMKSVLGDHVLRNVYDQKAKMAMNLLPAPSTLEQNKTIVVSVNKLSERSNTFANGIREHVKGKLSFGVKMLQVGGNMEKVFIRIFDVREGERLLKASRCSLFTTAGPVAGLLFISTDRLAFCSNKSVVKFSSPTGELLRFRYKVVIPLGKIKRATNQIENTKKSSQKYLQVVTTDDFEFWFMGFLSYKKTFQCLQQAVSQV